jgi:hypothetical protein
VVPAAHHSLRRFLTQKADTLLEGIADGIAPSIMLPASLSRPANAKSAPKENKGGTQTPSDKAKEKEKEKEKDKTIKEKQMPKGPVSNPQVSPTWAIPAGSTYEGLFQAPSPNLGGWPLIKDPRHTRPKPLCIRYQALGTCQTNCYLGHIQKSRMTPKDVAAADALFKTAYTK